MKIAVLLYDDMTALDAIGPYEVLSRLPGAEVQFVAENAGPVRADTGFLRLSADYAISEIGDSDILVVPGGPGDQDHVSVQASPAWAMMLPKRWWELATESWSVKPATWVSRSRIRSWSWVTGSDPVGVFIMAASLTG